MICKNCGATYDDSLLECPFCSAENSKRVEEYQKEVLNDYIRKEQELDRVLEKGKKSTPLFVKILAIALGGIVCICIIAGIIGLGVSTVRTKTLEKNTERLEQLYRNGDYKEMYDLYMKIDYHSDIHVYGDIGSTYDFIEGMRESDSWKIENALSENDSSYLGNLRFYAQYYSRIDELRQKGYAYDYQEGYDNLEDNINSYIKENYSIEPSELRAGVEFCEDENNPFWDEIQELSLERLKGK